MSYYDELIKSEIQLADDECCIVFDFGCYFPYSNFDVLTFEFSLGMEEFNDYKINHRFPNKGWQTISKKYGRKLSKLGYPYIMKLNKQGAPMLLCLKVGIEEKYMTLVFPIKTNMTKDKPICGLSLKYEFDKSRFYFTSCEKAEDGQGWRLRRWWNCKFDGVELSEFDSLLNLPYRVSDDSYTAVYGDVIEPGPMPLLDFFLP